jgi:PKD domain/Secretion system C-terminal sorting domain
MIKLVSLGLLSVLFVLSLNAQPVDHMRDYSWPLGYDYFGVDTSFTHLAFTNTGPIVIPKTDGIFCDATTVAISDKAGEMLFYTNGTKIVYPNGSLIENGDSLYQYLYNYFESSSNFDAVLLPQGAILIPKPGTDSLYYLFHEEVYNEMGQISVLRLNMTEILVDTLTGDALVISKSVGIEFDSLAFGGLTMCRHANGRDWWLINGTYPMDSLYTYLITPAGIEEFPKTKLNSTISGLIRVMFSPDGTKYIQTYGISGVLSSAIKIFDFNRQTGALSNELLIDLPETKWLLGLSISPNSRFLYAFNQDTIWQYDLQADDIASSSIIVGINDGFNQNLPTKFKLGQLAPDGRIYIGTGNTTRFLHYINNPDQLGTGCNLVQHGLQLQWYNNGLPNFPHFRLGPIDGSPADTLGIDNIPVAGWRHDTLPELVVDFTDNSYYDVQHWAWSFGDGGTDTVEHPVHTYNAPGYYWVCQEVSNDNAADTLCKWVQVGMGSDTIVYNTVGEYGLQVGLRVYPNPTSDFVFVQGEQAIAPGHVLILTDALGRECVKSPLAAMISSIDLRGLPTGVYFYRIEQADGRVRQAGKILVNGRR